ncbi:MAG: FAD:protein FMN transferase [Thermochromatium sp.]
MRRWLQCRPDRLNGRHGPGRGTGGQQDADSPDQGGTRAAGVGVQCAVGPLPDGEPWRIGIRDPERTERLLGDVLMTGGALATSGDYARCVCIAGRRYGPILNPRTGWPVLGLVSVSVIAASCLVAGSLSTIAMLKGRAGIQWLQSRRPPSVDRRRG